MYPRVPFPNERNRSHGPASPPGRIASLAHTPASGPQPPTTPAVRPRPGPRNPAPPAETVAIIDLTTSGEDLDVIARELVPVGTGVATVGGDLPSGRRVIDMSASVDDGGFDFEERWEPFELSRSTRELLAGLPPTPFPADDEPPRRPEQPVPARNPWPEIRFYIGSAALFFVAFMLATAFWVVLPTVVLGWSPNAITSGSMEPAIRTGDVVVGNPNVPTDLAPGAVVTFEANTGMLITHRVIDVGADGRYITRGDANSDPDRPSITHDDIRSVGRILVPLAGYPSVWAQSGAWWAVFAMGAVAVGLVIASRWALLTRYNPWLADELVTTGPAS
jgi:signal peptidase